MTVIDSSQHADTKSQQEDQLVDDAASSAAPIAADAGQTEQNAANVASDQISGLTVQVVNTLREWYILASDSIVSLLEGRLMQQPAQDIWLLGRHYQQAESSSEQDEQQGQQSQQQQTLSWLQSYPQNFVKDFSRLIWCTYRSQYPPISPTAFTTDSGWGCMLRAGQTLLAQALQLHHFGRDWDFDWKGTSEKDIDRRLRYIGIVKQFFDNYSSSSVFSIHQMASLGSQLEGKGIGQWFGPYGTAAIIRELAVQSNHELSIYTTTDGTVYLADICEPEFKPTLVLVATMLGIDRVNPIYYPFIQASLTLPQSAGIAGGRPSSALYFAGFQGDEMIYLDPHFTRPAVAQRQDSEYTESDLASYSCSTPRRLAISRLDPCMVFGYYCGTLESLIDLRSRIDLLVDDGMQTVVSFNNGSSPSTAADATSTLVKDGLQTEDPEAALSSLAPRSQVNDGSGVLVKLPRPPSGSSLISVDGASVVIADDDADVTGDVNSACSEISLEKGSSGEEEWVTDI
ncbi:Cysteine protease atg4 [Coemansia asiatica]|uniref:Cysteine protease n=1 Tax=Coemansia asiatica TaxID=1052880 RepID=A0A9W7XF57_9FUNG|nr:Cysteine protease atg4 [Coemansia asiatica]